MIRIIQFIFRNLLYIALAFLCSCSLENKHKIGFLLPNLQASRFEKEKEYFISKTKSLDCEAFVTSADNDENLQIKQAKELIDKKVNALVIIAVNQYIAAKIVRMANDNGIKVIAYERMIANADLDFYIGPDGEQIGEEMARYVLHKKPQGNMIILGGDMGDDGAYAIHKGEMKVLNAQIMGGKIKILYDLYIEDWDQQEAFSKVNYFSKLSTEEPDIVLSSYDGLTYGAISALKENNLFNKDIIITGQDAELKACQYIYEGSQTMTMYHSYKQQAETAAVIAMDLILHKPVMNQTTKFNGYKNVASVIIDSKIVDQSNLQKFISNERYYPENEIHSPPDTIK